MLKRKLNPKVPKNRKVVTRRHNWYCLGWWRGKMRRRSRGRSRRGRRSKRSRSERSKRR